MENSHKIRLSDIAEKFSVSTVTVSKAIADKEGVSDELREKIKRMAREMGYKQKSTKEQSSIPENSTGNIGILIPTRCFGRHAPFYWNMYNALSRELQENGRYAIMEQLDEKSESDLVLPGVIRDKKVDGLLILGEISPDYARYILRSCPNLLFIDFYMNEDGIDSVTTDDFYGGYIMAGHLLKLGHKDIRYVGNFNSTESSADRYMGFLKAMLENGCETKISGIINDMDQDGNPVEINLPEKIPTAFICSTNESAFRLIEILNEKGYKVPDDISVTGFGNFSCGGTPDPILTAMETDQDAKARTAVSIILSKTSGKPYAKGRTAIGGKLIIRKSSGKNRTGENQKNKGE